MEDFDTQLLNVTGLNSCILRKREEYIAPLSGTSNRSHEMTAQMIEKERHEGCATV